jgi:hypothetical protein
MRTNLVRCIGYQSKMNTAKRLKRSQDGISHETLRLKIYFEPADFDAQKTQTRKTSNKKVTTEDTSEGEEVRDAQNVGVEGDNAAKRGKRHDDAMGSAMQLQKKQRDLRKT